jgi:hypothetical protein
MDEGENNSGKRPMGPPRKPLTPYFMFVREFRATNNGTISGTAVEINKVLGDRWNALSEEEKGKYNEMSKISKVRYQEEMEIYKKENPDFNAVRFSLRLCSQIV